MNEVELRAETIVSDHHEALEHDEYLVMLREGDYTETNRTVWSMRTCNAGGGGWYPLGMMTPEVRDAVLARITGFAPVLWQNLAPQVQRKLITYSLPLAWNNKMDDPDYQARVAVMQRVAPAVTPGLDVQQRLTSMLNDLRTSGVRQLELQADNGVLEALLDNARFDLAAQEDHLVDMESRQDHLEMRMNALSVVNQKLSAALADVLVAAKSSRPGEAEKALNRDRLREIVASHDLHVGFGPVFAAKTESLAKLYYPEIWGAGVTDPK